MPTSPTTRHNKPPVAPHEGTGRPHSLEGSFRAVAVRAGTDALTVTLEDGREVIAAYSLFPRLAQASPAARRRWELIGRGTGLHWPELDEHISVYSIVHPERTVLAREQPAARTSNRGPRRGSHSARTR